MIRVLVDSLRGTPNPWFACNSSPLLVEVNFTLFFSPNSINTLNLDITIVASYPYLFAWYDAIQIKFSEV